MITTSIRQLTCNFYLSVEIKAKQQGAKIQSSVLYNFPDDYVGRLQSRQTTHLILLLVSYVNMKAGRNCSMR
jgi:hypothetical protein